MSPTVVFLEDNQDLRDLLQSIIESSLQVSCAAYESVKNLIANEATVLQSRIVILDIELGFKQPTGIDAYQWLIEKKFNGHIFFLTGHGYSNPLVQAASKAGVTIWEKPISSAQIVSNFKSILEYGAQDIVGAV
ncbi:MAG: response regulator [Bdellovibrio sp.]|nr:response regulator [Bdellovibrio sp.]